MNHPFHESGAPSVFWWILITGGIGFAAGFFGPIALNPEANQGPLVGIFVSGPVGALLSLVLYLLSRPLHFSASTLMLVTFLATICRYRAHYQMANQRVSDLCDADAFSKGAKDESIFQLRVCHRFP